MKLDDDETALLASLRDAANDGGGAFIHVSALQRDSGVLFLRTPLDRLRKRGLVEHDGARRLDERYWTITDKGKETFS